MKYCTKCILPETFPGVSFNKDGVCNFCLEDKPAHKIIGKEKLLAVLLSNAKRAKYDCVVPLSGGKDSTFILFYVVKELGLNPIAVSYNSGYQTKLAEENIYNACKILKTDLIEIKSPGKIQTQLLKASYAFSKKLNKGWDVCLNCPSILRVIPINVAKKFKIPFIVWGGSAIESINRKKPQKKEANVSFRSVIIRKVKTIIRIIKKLSSDFSLIKPSIKYVFLRSYQRFVLRFPLKSVFSPFKNVSRKKDDPEFINFFDYIEWDSLSAVEQLKQKLNWKHPMEKDSRFDCQLHSVNNEKYLNKFGISHDGITFCQFIREGKMSRKDALQREMQVAKITKLEYNELLNKII